MKIRLERQRALLDTSPMELRSGLLDIEEAARGCYESKKSVTGVDREFIGRLIERGHESPIEFGHMKAIFTTSRAITHEIVRHRLFSFCQTSTRYVNYQQKNYIPIIIPSWVNQTNVDDFKHSCQVAADLYEKFIMDGRTPQEARDILPNATGTTLHVSGNFRVWRNFFKMRTAPNAHPEMRLLASDLLRQVLKVPDMDVIFGEFAG